MPTIAVVGRDRLTLYTEAETARMIGVSERTVRSYLRSGRIPYVRIRRKVYIEHNNLLEYLRGARTSRIYQQIAAIEFQTDFTAPPDVVYGTLGEEFYSLPDN